MVEQQQTIINLKNYLNNIRSRIFNDNNAGLTDPAKIFEGIVVALYNINYSVNDFKGFGKSNNPCIDLKSDTAKKVVSVKARADYQNKSQIDEIVICFNKHYTDLNKYDLILQELSDKPKNTIKTENIDIRYFGELCNLFNDSPSKLKLVQAFIDTKRSSMKTQSYLNFIYDNYFLELNISINNIFGKTTYNIYEYLKVENCKLTLLDFKSNIVHFLKTLQPLWNEIKNKDYLKLDISDEAIEILDNLWWIGYSNNQFHPLDPTGIIPNLDEELWLSHLNNDNSYVIIFYKYLIKIYNFSVDLKITIRKFA